MRAKRLSIGFAMLAAIATGLAAPANAVNTGPALSVPAATLNAALKCTGNLATSTGVPVLFLHGTTANSKVNWSWNWDKAMNSAHRAHCDLDAPDGGTGDIQIAGEYVVNAIRVMHRKAGTKISIVGHSQGGMVGRWALKYWPDTRAMVDDYVGLSSSNHGSQGADALCSLPNGCSAAGWQQRSKSNFLKALNTGPETWPGISYTEISTRFDEIVSPTTSVFLKPATNVTNTYVQDTCPLELVEHFGMAYDNAAWLVGNDALTHAGPAKLSRVNKSTCGVPFMPAVNPVTFATDAAGAMLAVAQNTASAKSLKAEPA
ncbi:MAG: lipase, partial [Aeromicrobium sp.]